MSARKRPEEYGYSGWTRRTFSLLPKRLMKFENYKRENGGLVIGWFHDGWGWGIMDAYFNYAGEDRYRMAIPGLTVRLGHVRKAGEVDHSGQRKMRLRWPSPGNAIQCVLLGGAFQLAWTNELTASVLTLTVAVWIGVMRGD